MFRLHMFKRSDTKLSPFWYLSTHTPFQFEQNVKISALCQIKSENKSFTFFVNVAKEQAREKKYQ